VLGYPQADNVGDRSQKRLVVRSWDCPHLRPTISCCSTPCRIPAIAADPFCDQRGTDSWPCLTAMYNLPGKLSAGVPADHVLQFVKQHLPSLRPGVGLALRRATGPTLAEDVQDVDGTGSGSQAAGKLSACRKSPSAFRFDHHRGFAAAWHMKIRGACFCNGNGKSSSVPVAELQIRGTVPAGNDTGCRQEIRRPGQRIVETVPTPSSLQTSAEAREKSTAPYLPRRHRIPTVGGGSTGRRVEPFRKGRALIALNRRRPPSRGADLSSRSANVRLAFLAASGNRRFRPIPVSAAGGRGSP